MRLERFKAAGLDCISVEPEPARQNLPLIIGLHGRGDWGESYTDIADMISETDYRYVFPTAPLPLPGALFEWFRFEGGNLAHAAIATRQNLFSLFNELATRYHTPASQTFLFGFSQGGMMTLDAGLRYRDEQGQPLSGLACLSGLLLADVPMQGLNFSNPQLLYDKDKGDLQQTVAQAVASKIPVFIAHGTYDPVVPKIAGRTAYEVLKAAGVLAEYYEFAGEHQISLDEIKILHKFIQVCLKQ